MRVLVVLAARTTAKALSRPSERVGVPCVTAEADRDGLKLRRRPRVAWFRSEGSVLAILRRRTRGRCRGSARDGSVAVRLAEAMDSVRIRTSAEIRLPKRRSRRLERWRRLMLSIGKLATGQADYYLEQARARSTRAQRGDRASRTTTSAGPRPPATGSAPARRRSGCAATVGGDALDRVLAGEHPATGEPLGRRARRARVPGFDLTFSAPKSVSVLFGVGDDALRARDQDAHDAAVRRRSATWSAQRR